jgi:hypothetical protein
LWLRGWVCGGDERGEHHEKWSDFFIIPIAFSLESLAPSGVVGE